MRARLRKVLLFGAVAGVAALLALEPGRDKAAAVAPPGSDTVPKGDSIQASPAGLELPERHAPGRVRATAELKMTALSLQGAGGRAIAHEQISAFRTAIQ